MNRVLIQKADITIEVGDVNKLYLDCVILDDDNRPLSLSQLAQLIEMYRDKKAKMYFEVDDDFDCKGGIVNDF